ncbi:hypothetical protein NX059_001251 [Plenodomus lindquistii]|nr:hypothetical protein NX059_001251 [Plenodomus lindquistii]
MESYEQCLGRGLLVAERKVFQIGFQYPDIREDVMNWTEENCGRLIHSPQVVTSNKEQLVMKWWAKKAHQSRRILRVVASSITRSTKWICSKSVGRIFPRVARICQESPLAEESKDLSNTVKTQLPRPIMPFGFDLNCTTSPPCHLTYSRANPVSSDKTAALPEMLTSLNHIAVKLRKMQNGLLSTSITSYHVAWILAKVLLMTGLMSLVSLLLVPQLQSVIGLDQKAILSWRNLQYKMISLILGSFFMGLLTALTLPRCEVPHNGYGTLYQGLPLCGIGLAMLIAFFWPPHQQSYQLRFTSLYEEVRHIMQIYKFARSNINNKSHPKKVLSKSVKPGNNTEGKPHNETLGANSDTLHNMDKGAVKWSREIPRYQATCEDYDEEFDATVNGADFASAVAAAADELDPADWTMVDV